jgi:hypothetical protein
MENIIDTIMDVILTMAKKKSSNWIIVAVLGAGALFLLSKAGLTKADNFSGGYGGSSAMLPPMPSIVDGGFVLPSGEAYYPEEDPIKALRYTPTLSKEALMLQAMTELKGRELRAKEIMPVVQNLSHQEVKTAVLSSSPKTLKSYSRVVRGTIKRQLWNDSN